MGQDNRRLQATASNHLPILNAGASCSRSKDGVFYDFTDIYHRLYEHNVDICAVVDWVKSIEIAFWLINLDTHHTFYLHLQATLPDDPVDVVCEMM